MKGNCYIHEERWQEFQALGVTFTEIPNFHVMSDEEQDKLIRKPDDPMPTFKQLAGMPTISMVSPAWHLVEWEGATEEQADRVFALAENGQYGPDE